MVRSIKAARGDAIPLYHQIFLGLRDEIVSGRRPLGAAMPTEHELAADHDVSRITARRALDELAQNGFVERKRRIGTRVTFRTQIVPIEANLEQALESLLAFGRSTGVRVLEVVHEPADADVAAKLRLDEGDAVVRAARLRSLDNEPLGLIVSHVPAAIGGAITVDALAATPILALLAADGHAIGSGEQTISARSADPALAEALAIEPRAAVLRIERVVNDAGRTPLLLTVASYRADRYRIILDLHGA